MYANFVDDNYFFHIFSLKSYNQIKTLWKENINENV